MPKTSSDYREVLRLAELDSAFSDDLRRAYGGPKDPIEALRWHVNSRWGSPADKERRAQLQRIVFSRQGDEPDSATARQELQTLEARVESDLLALDTAVNIAILSRAVRQESRTSDLAEANASKPEPLARGKKTHRRRFVMAGAALATVALAIGVVATVGMLRNPLRVFDTDELTGPRLPAVLQGNMGYTDVHFLRSEKGWYFYAARDADNDVCFLATYTDGGGGSGNCVPETEFVSDGIEIGLLVARVTMQYYGEDDDLVPATFRWDTDGYVYLSFNDPPDAGAPS